MSSDFNRALRNGLQQIGVSATDEQVGLLENHFEILLRVNQQFNLTRIVEPEVAALRLYADSAAVVAWAQESGARITRVLDVGSGAGFPAVPMAVLMPTWPVTAVEATHKKADFISDWAMSQGLANLQAIHAHTRHWVPPGRFDLVTFKAVGSLSECLRLAHPHLRKHGLVVVFKTLGVEQGELDEARKVASEFGFREQAGFEYECGNEDPPARFKLHIFKEG